ncbi:dynein axonemal assembly factor 8-like isoform X2 [Narcine bancroftii]|uniref:dynein axonemal assembly factor 8-like isoform X2 n=1 Tax=Narcine bancroftii TaxID=1343680 RepID=UPI003831970B
MTSYDNPKTAGVGESSYEFQRLNDSLRTAHDDLKSFWDMIFEDVKDELPSLDSDLTSSGSEDGEVAIFQRDTSSLISCLPEDLRDFSLDDPVLEEMLESARCPPEAWATENIERNDHEDFWGEALWHLENSTGIEKYMKGEPGPFNGGGPTDSTSSVDFITDKNLLHLEAESKPDEKAPLANLNNNGGGDPYSSRKQKVISNKEQKSLECRTTVDGNLDYWCIPTAGFPKLTTSKDFVKIMSEDTSQAILDKTASPEIVLINSSKNHKQVSKEKQRRRELMCAGWQTHNPPVLSLESIEEADLDEILRSLQHVKVHNSNLKNHGPDAEDLVNTSWSGSGHSHVNNEKNLMEQLTLLCTKHLEEAVTLNSQALMCIREHESKEPWIRNDEGRTNDLKKIISPETGSYSLEMGRILPVIKTSEPKTVFTDLWNRKKGRNASQTSCRNGKENDVNLQNESQYLRATDLQSRESCRKERQSRQQLHRQLESLKPLRSVTGKQPSAKGTPLFNMETSYLPNIWTLPKKERCEILLFKAHLSSCDQLVSGRQQAAFSLDSASITPNQYNALLSWLFCLIHSNVKDRNTSPEFPHRRHLLRTVAFTHMYPSTLSMKEDLLVPKVLHQTMCLLLTAPLFRTHHLPYIELLDQLQDQRVAEIISTGNIPATRALLRSGPCLMLALDRDHGICCFGSLLNSLIWEKLNLQDCLRNVIDPKTESQAALTNVQLDVNDRLVSSGK